MPARTGGGLEWPEGKRFAFTIIDDTDRSTVARTRPVYDVLADHGLRTTKTVWPLKARGEVVTGGDSLEDPGYLSWVLELRDRGFEIGIHGAADESSPRERVELALDRFAEAFGAGPSVHINHVGQADGLYWGADRLDAPASWAYGLYRRIQGGIQDHFGHVPGSPYFWGDLAQSRIRYVRNLVWHGIDTLAADPLMPYHDPGRPWVKYWFSASYGSGRQFQALLRQENLDRLAASGGACIVYTHLGSFDADEVFRDAIRRVARMDGWFVPVSTLLDHVGGQRGWTDVRQRRRQFQAMQLRWLWEQARHRTG